MRTCWKPGEPRRRNGARPSTNGSTAPTPLPPIPSLATFQNFCVDPPSSNPGSDSMDRILYRRATGHAPHGLRWAPRRTYYSSSCCSWWWRSCLVTTTPRAILSSFGSSDRILGFPRTPSSGFAGYLPERWIGSRAWYSTESSSDPSEAPTSSIPLLNSPREDDDEPGGYDDSHHHHHHHHHHDDENDELYNSAGDVLRQGGWRFDPQHPPEYWVEETERWLHDVPVGHMTREDFDGAEQAARWWITHHRPPAWLFVPPSGSSSSSSSSSSRSSSSTGVVHEGSSAQIEGAALLKKQEAYARDKELAVLGVQSALELFQRNTREIQERAALYRAGQHPPENGLWEEIETDPVKPKVDDSPDYMTVQDGFVDWYRGRYPRATHLLIAILDTWRICWRDRLDQTSVVSPGGGKEEGASPSPPNNLEPENTARRLPSPMEMLQFLQDLTAMEPGVPLNTRAFSLIMQAAVQRGDPTETPLFCERLLDYQFDYHRARVAQDPSLKRSDGFDMLQHPAMSALPDTVAFTTALNAWAKSGRPDAARRCEELLQTMIRLDEERPWPELSVQPNNVAYNTVLGAMVITKKVENLKRAESILRNMMESPFTQVVPCTVSFQLMMYGWTEFFVDGAAGKRQEGEIITKEILDDAINRAIELLNEMVRLYHAGNVNVQVDVTHFARIILALSRTTAPIGMGRDPRYSGFELLSESSHAYFAKAIQLFQELMDLYTRTGEPRFKPDAHILNGMLRLYAKNGQPDHAEEVLNLMEAEGIDLKIEHYKNALFSWVQKEDVERAESCYLRMLEKGVRSKNLTMVPNRDCLDSVLFLWASSPRDDAGERAHQLMLVVDRAYRETGFRMLRFGGRNFYNVLLAWSRSRSPSAADYAQEIFNEMQRRAHQEEDWHARPDRVHYRLVAKAWGRSGRLEATDKCIRLLDEACNAFQSGYVEARPDVALYRAVLMAAVKDRDVAKAEHVLDRMIKDYRAGNAHASPDTKTMNILLLSYSRRADLSDAPERALAIFQVMEGGAGNLGKALEPDEDTYSMMLGLMSRSSKFSRYSAMFEKKLKEKRRSARAPK